MKSDAIIISTAIDYQSISFDELEAFLVDYHERRSDSRPQAFLKRSYFGQFYQGETTCGLSLRGIGDQIRAYGIFSDTHRILSWWSSIDVAVFGRALLGCDQIITLIKWDELVSCLDADGNNALQPVNISVLIKGCSDVANGRCGNAHRSLFPEQPPMEMHLPENDTLAMN